MQTTWTLEPSTIHLLRAAEGWLELGNAFEANGELEQLPPQMRVHPAVLILRWRICANRKMWDVCLMIANALTDDIPDDPCGWIALAQSLRFQGKPRKAFDLARSKALEFIDSWQLLYDAARYGHLVGETEQAEQLFLLALAAGNPREIRRRAESDPDLVGFCPSRHFEQKRAETKFVVD